MSQSSVIFGALFVGFLVYITMRGELSQYGAAFAGTAQGPSQSGSSSSGGNGGGIAGVLGGVMGGGDDSGGVDMGQIASYAAIAAAFV